MSSAYKPTNPLQTKRGQTRRRPRDSGSLTSWLRSEFGFIAGNFLIMVTSWLVLDFASELPATYYPLYIQALGGTAASIGLIGAIEGISRGIVQIPGGYLADKYGRKWLIASMTFVAAFSRLLYVFAPTWEWIAVGALLVGVTNIYGPALMAIVADSVPKEKRGMAFSIINLINSVSTTPAPLLAGLLYAEDGSCAEHEARLRRRLRRLPGRRPDEDETQGDRREAREVQRRGRRGNDTRFDA